MSPARLRAAVATLGRTAWTTTSQLREQHAAALGDGASGELYAAALLSGLIQAGLLEMAVLGRALGFSLTVLGPAGEQHFACVVPAKPEVVLVCLADGGITPILPGPCTWTEGRRHALFMAAEACGVNLADPPSPEAAAGLAAALPRFMPRANLQPDSIVAEWGRQRAALQLVALALHAQQTGSLSARTAASPPDYSRAVLCLDPVYHVRLALVDVGASFMAHVRGFVGACLAKPRAMAAMVLNWNPDAEQRAGSLPLAVRELLGWSVQHNPFYRRWLAVVELARHGASGVPFLTPAAVAGFVAEVQARGPLPLATEDNAAAARSLLSVVVPVGAEVAAVRPGRTGPSTYAMGTLTPRNPDHPAIELEVGRSGEAVGDAATALSAEEAHFPFLFPDAMGACVGSTLSLCEYLRYRSRCLFSLFTLCKPYLMLMYVLRQATMMRSSYIESVLESAVTEYKAKHPEASDQEVVHHVIKHKLPETLPNTPAWHRKNLQDLLCLVDRWGMPSLFLTLTADEVSDTRWPEVQNINEKLQDFCSGFTWKDAPAENAYLFHCRCKAFMHEVLQAARVEGKPGPLGRVTHWVSRYEVQNRHSVHAHIILWLHPDDVEQACSEIVGCVPADYLGDDSDPTCPYAQREHWRVPTDEHQAQLFHHVLTKQLHTCREAGKAGCCQEGPCRYKFPFAPHQSLTPELDPETQAYKYYRPSWPHRNVVPYHPVLALLWGAHMNLQRINSSNWSFYVLKYAMKAEPTGSLRLDPASCVALGLEDERLEDGTAAPASYFHRLVTAFLTSTTISPSLAFLACAGISTVEMSAAVTAVDTSPPAVRTRRVLNTAGNRRGARDNVLSLPAVNVYSLRPDGLEGITLYDYFLNYVVGGAQPRGAELYPGRSRNGQAVYKFAEPRLVRFTDFNPAGSPEPYFYNLLLSQVPFRHEAELISRNNASGTYFEECQRRGIIHNTSDLDTHLQSYASYHLFDRHQREAMLATLLSKYTPDEALDTFGGEGLFGQADDAPAGSNGAGGREGGAEQGPGSAADTQAGAAGQAATTAASPAAIRQAAAARLMQQLQKQQQRAERQQRRQASAIADEFSELDGTPLTEHQQGAVDGLLGAKGLHLLSGGPGSGKTFTVRKLTRQLRQAGKSVQLAAATGAAAVRLSPYASTAHGAFVLPVGRGAQGKARGGGGSSFRALSSTDARCMALQNTDVFIIDEYSMLTAAMLHLILMRLWQASGLASIEEMLEQKLIILVGDHAQLPAVCPCDRRRAKAAAPSTIGASGLCMACHICTNKFFRECTKHHLPISVRHALDQPFSAFLDICRVRRPTQAEIDAIFPPSGPAYITEAAVAATATPTTTVLCTHVEDTRAHNHRVLARLSATPGSGIGPIHMCRVDHDVTDPIMLNRLSTWLQDPDFHTLPQVAVGARVMITQNLALQKGSVNGATGVVQALEVGGGGDVVSIEVLLDHNGGVVKVGRSETEFRCTGGFKFTKRSFPLALGWAITGHKSQGGTYKTQTVVHARSCFVPGLMYVMLSRVTESRLLRIVGRLTPDLFDPVDASVVLGGGASAMGPAAT
ncbi:hypothetical protein HYH03_018605 [Edaphochlamys debaryana]|uniref:AAA+ ATPase domain-containing protein n=1 Tax=Edaphochlamys debaryana TaxID=47281 RepID=A0A835XFJ7_9CHLO|nr:hypothetical protein HYH03_018605 [Edaphochlamys debaryana]|eukprot:KAG2482459.1 hypothetical protein HYH03_018605 [Edaphochlamys debaryana]